VNQKGERLLKTETYSCDKCKEVFEFFEGYYLTIDRLAIKGRPVRKHLCPDCKQKIERELI
jgi:uncharacterized protein YlaI